MESYELLKSFRKFILIMRWKVDLKFVELICIGLDYIGCDFQHADISDSSCWFELSPLPGY